MLIVEDGSVVTGANSYGTAQEAMDYFFDRGITLEITDGNMIAATDFVDTTYGPSYKSKMYDIETQALLFPRMAFYDNNGRHVEEQTIPKELKIAVYQSAKLASEGIQLIDNQNPDSQIASFTKTIEGAVSKSESYFAPVNRTQTSYVGKYIYPILDRSNTGRTVRA